MNLSTLLARSTGVLAAAAAALALAAVPASAATSPDYTEASYLQRALGLPASDTNPVIEPVTFDRFQWLLQQPGDHAVLIGDPATDATFAARAQDVEAAAKAAGAKAVSWFNPNLSGSAKVDGVTEPALDIRNPAGITQLPAASQAKYGSAWLGLVGSYLGDGVTATWNEPHSEEGTIDATTGTTTVNDAGRTPGQSTKVGDANGGALYDYTTGAPATVGHSFFFIYNKADADGKVVSWTDLTAQPGSAAAKADVTTAIGTVGAANVTDISEFAWWKDEVDARQKDQAPTTAQGVDVPVLADAADGTDWRIHQITYPELVDLLEHNDDNNAVILFGGTWCPNTRPVLSAVNKHARQNDVQVYNFDTVLDGGFAGGATTSSANPLQIRNTQSWAVDKTTTIQKSNPSFLYGDLVDHYLTNIKTQYDYTKGQSAVTYYRGGDYASALTTTSKLQVPFVIGYRGAKGAEDNGGVTRQWIIKKDDGSYTEYMSQWWYTNPQPNQLGITTIPLTAPIWATINAQLASFTWQTDPKAYYPNTAIDTDDADYLVDADKATVKYTAANGSTPASITVTSGGATTISPAALSAALSALGASAPANLPAARTALIAQQVAGTVDPNLTTVVGAWGVAQLRKTKVLNTWGSATVPGSVAGGLAAVHALDVFFSGLPRGVVSRRTVTADPVVAGTAPKITVKIDNDYGRVPTGTLSLVVKQGDATVATASAAVAQDQASFTLPALATGTYAYTLSYGDDAQLLAFTDTGSLTVTPAPVGDPPASPATPITTKTPPATKPVTLAGTTTRVKLGKVKGLVAKAPTSKKGGKYTITVATPKGAKAPTGKVTIKLKKGKTTKTVTGTLKAGKVTIALPKLARGTWKVTISFPGDARYLKASVAGASIKIIK
jgi:hypothetical protein